MPRLRPLLALFALVLVVPFAACGEGNDPVAFGKTESIYVTTGGLRYQVQASRKLNPYDVEDKDYLVGVPKAAEQVANAKYAWYGVFVRAENRSDKGDGPKQTITSAPSFKLEDNQGDSALPTVLPADNVYGYHATDIEAGGQLPLKSSTAASGPMGGSLILFKVEQVLLERRPVQLVIQSADGKEARIDLDV